MNILSYIFIFLLGINVGSFLNVCIYRMPIGESVAWGRSHCPYCNKILAWYELIPFLSYIFLKGKCSKCERKISLQYPIVELLNGVIWVFTYKTFGFEIQTVFYLLITSILIIISFVDIKSTTISNKLVLLIFIMGLILACFSKDLTFTDRLIGFFAASVPILIISLLTNGGFGGGDIKLLAVMGIFLGWKLVLLSLMLGIVLGAVVASILLLLGTKKRKDIIPFGPFLCAGFIFATLLGNPIINWYFNHF